MRCTLLIIFLLTVPLPFLRTAQTQQPTQEPKKPLPEQPLPNTADYSPAGPSCKRRHKVDPWIGTPGVDWPNTFQCVLKIHTCEGVKTSVSGVRSAGTGMCDDFWRVYNALAQLEICCDKGSAAPPVPAPLPPPPKPTPEPDCADSNVTPTISIDLAETLNIDETPQMPEMTATAKVTPSSTDVTWTAEITFSAPGGASCSGGPKFDSPKVSGSGETFTPNFGAIYGGKLEIKAKTTCGRGAETTITRNVGGLNADPSDVRTEIGTMDSPFEADDLKKIACHESRQRQFTGSNRPTLGPSSDAGIMQICYQRTVADIWNWKTNVARGRANLLAAAAYSRNVPHYTRRGYYMAGGKRKEWLPQGGGPFPNATDFTPAQLRLEAIKRYNAGYLPGVGYWEWDDAAGAWIANPQGGGDPNYVANVTGQNANCP